MNNETVARQDALLADRAARIDSLGAQRDSNGLYRVQTGWDRNEVVGKDGLRTAANGQVSLWLNGDPAWHRLGTVTDGVTNIDQVLADSGLNFRVEKRPLFFGATDESKMGMGVVNLGQMYATVRIDDDGTETQLGTVGKVYEPFQNREAFDFLQELTGQGEGSFTSAGELSQGATVFVTMQLGDDIVLDADGAADVIKKYVMFKNGHDGKNKLGAFVTPTRAVCANTVRWGVENAWTSWETRHTKGVGARVEEARRTLRLVRDYYDRFEADATDLLHTPMTEREFDDFLTDVVFPVDTDAKQFVQDRQTKAQDITRNLWASSPTNETVRGTRWGAAQAVTEYLDHYADVRAPKSLRLDEATPKTMQTEIARGARVLNGSDDEKKNQVHRALLTWKR